MAQPTQSGHWRRKKRSCDYVILEASLHNKGKKQCPFRSFRHQEYARSTAYFLPTTRSGYRTRNSMFPVRSVRSRADNASEPFAFLPRIQCRPRELNWSLCALCKVGALMYTLVDLDRSRCGRFRPKAVVQDLAAFAVCFFFFKNRRAVVRGRDRGFGDDAMPPAAVGVGTATHSCAYWMLD